MAPNWRLWGPFPFFSGRQSQRKGMLLKSGQISHGIDFSDSVFSCTAVARVNSRMCFKMPKYISNVHL